MATSANIDRFLFINLQTARDDSQCHPKIQLAVAPTGYRG